MLRKLAMVGVVAGAAAYFPFVYEKNPDAVQGVVEAALKETPKAEPQRPLVVVQRAEMEKPKASGRKVRIEADKRGHFAADFKINGRSVEAMVDTGATLLAINESTARKLGLPLTASSFDKEVNTANGKIRAATAVLNDVQLGRIKIDGVQAMVLEDKALDGTLIGMSFLSRLSSFRVENGAMVLEQ